MALMMLVMEGLRLCTAAGASALGTDPVVPPTWDSCWVLLPPGVSSHLLTPRRQPAHTPPFEMQIPHVNVHVRQRCVVSTRDPNGKCISEGKPLQRKAMGEWKVGLVVWG